MGCQGRKEGMEVTETAHTISFQRKLLGPTPKALIVGPQKKFVCFGKCTKNSDLHKISHRNFTVKNEVPNGPFAHGDEGRLMNERMKLSES